MSNPNILPLPTEFPHVRTLSQDSVGEREVRRIAFQCGQIAVARLDTYEGVMRYHPDGCAVCRKDDLRPGFLLGIVAELKAKGYTKEQVLAAMEEDHAS